MDQRRGMTALLLVAVLAASSFARSAVYKDEITLYSDIVEKSPNKARPHNNLGEVLKKAGRIPEAQAHLERAIAIEPDYPDALNNLATIYSNIGRKGEAIVMLQRCLSLNPGHVQARFNLAMQLYENGMVAEAEKEYTLIALIAPASREAAFAMKMLQIIRSR
jgi:Flp pilus assembly protein TadD